MSHAILIALAAVCAQAQHYCWPCAGRHGVVGKYTYTASNPPKCFDFHMKYLNNVVVGSTNEGPGWRTIVDEGLEEVVTDNQPPNVMGVEVNECGTTLGNKGVNITPMSPLDRDLGRANIINGSVDESLDNFSAVEDEWGKEYTDRVRKLKPSWRRFGLHAVGCAYHSSGPCSLQDIERGVAAQWARNFSNGYRPLMDNNIMMQVETLGPLLDAFLRDGVDFYPMRWPAWRTPLEEPFEMYSILFSPCGKVLIEVAATSVGGRPAEQFHRMKHARALLHEANEPASWALQPLMPLRVSKAVSADKLEELLAFYGVGNSSDIQAHAEDLGFETKVLADEVDEHAGTRAVTLMLSPDAKTHMQFWVRPEEEPSSGPVLPSSRSFAASATRTQRESSDPKEAFCSSGSWTVNRYISYQLRLHEAVMTTPPKDPETSTPPVGFAQDVLIDDHISWDCTKPGCNIANGSRALYRSGSRIQWMRAASRGFPGWGPYGYDPAGYGIQLHWSNTPEYFKPQGKLYPVCFQAEQDGTCQGSETSDVFTV